MTKTALKFLYSSLFSFTCFFGYSQTNYYISPNGSDTSSGTIDHPFRHWDHINILNSKGFLKPGDTVFIRGGTYASGFTGDQQDHVLWQKIKGSADKKVVIMAYPGEFPILDLGNLKPTCNNPTAWKIEHCEYLHVKGLRVSGLAQVNTGSGLSRGLDIYYSKHCIFENLEIDHIGGYGLILGDSTVRSLFLNIDVHHIYDSLTQGNEWNNANGFQCTGGSTATDDTFRYCRAWKCSDDGFDFYRVNGRFWLEGCWAFWNGYKPNSFQPAGDGSGFKLGPDEDYPAPTPRSTHNKVLRTISRCVAFENRKTGFNQNAGDMRYIMHHNTSFRNGDRNFGYGFMWDYIHPPSKQDFRNNISYGDLYPTRGKETAGMRNSWSTGFALSPRDFKSMQSTGMDGARRADGRLPVLPFLRLHPRSGLVNAGISTNEVITDRPDLGAFELDIEP